MRQSHSVTTTKVHIANRYGRHLYSVPERQIPRAAFVPADRSLHLVDIENLMGDPERGDQALHHALADYYTMAPVVEGDHVVIGANPGLAHVAKVARPEARLLVRGGPDGADLRLLESVRDVPFIAARYDRIVIGSGDGIFEVVVRVYRSLGLPVGVVSRRQSLAGGLRQAATFVRLVHEVEIAEVTA